MNYGWRGKSVFDKWDFVFPGEGWIDGGSPQDHIPTQERAAVTNSLLISNLENPFANRVFAP